MRNLPAALTALTALALVAAAAVPAAASTTKSVVIKNISFQTPTVRIHRGDTVRWLFRDGVTSHNVTSRGTPHFRSSVSMRSGSYSVRFTKAGTYRYHCTIHANMTGRVVVS